MQFCLFHLISGVGVGVVALCLDFGNGAHKDSVISMSFTLN